MESRQTRPAGTGPAPAAATLVDEVQTLVWALIDAQISAAQMARLERLVLGQPQARAAYIRCMAMHAELQANFAAVQPPTASDPPLPLLAQLTIDGLAATDVRPPVAEL